MYHWRNLFSGSFTINVLMACSYESCAVCQETPTLLSYLGMYKDLFYFFSLPRYKVQLRCGRNPTSIYTIWVGRRKIQADHKNSHFCFCSINFYCSGKGRMGLLLAFVSTALFPGTIPSRGCNGSLRDLWFLQLCFNVSMCIGSGKDGIRWLRGQLISKSVW